MQTMPLAFRGRTVRDFFAAQFPKREDPGPK
jgi:hypothetical protein